MEETCCSPVCHLYVDGIMMIIKDVLKDWSTLKKEVACAEQDSQFRLETIAL